MGAICTPTESSLGEEELEDDSSDESSQSEEAERIIGVYLHVEYPVSIPFDKYPWNDANDASKQFNGLISKTWLSGVDDHTIGGFYEFDSRENAQNYIDNHLIGLAKHLGVGDKATYKIYNKDNTIEASNVMNSPFCRQSAN
eukprot:297941_1